MNIFLVILLFSLLILVHELGHFIAAKKSGIRVEEFGLGYPPRMIGFFKSKETKKLKIIWGHKNKEKINEKSIFSTIYSINWIPFGGFVKMLGENRESNKKSKEKKKIQQDSFEAKSAIKRSVVILAGVFFNVIFATLLLIIMFASGAPVVVNKENSAQLKDEAIVIAGISEKSPASKADLKIGDKIVDIFLPNEKTTTPNTVKNIQDFTNEHKGETIIMTIQRGKLLLEKKIIPRTTFPNDEGPIGIALTKTGIAKYSLYESIKKGFIYTFQLLQMICYGLFTIFKNLLTKGKMVGQITGPVGLFQLTSQAASLGISYLLHFGAIISLNLAIINILPIPALDGGRFLFILIEKIKGSPISAKVERISNSVAFSLLIFLMIFITIRDIIKLF